MIGSAPSIPTGVCSSQPEALWDIFALLIYIAVSGLTWAEKPSIFLYGSHLRRAGSIHRLSRGVPLSTLLLYHTWCDLSRGFSKVFEKFLVRPPRISKPSRLGNRGFAIALSTLLVYHNYRILSIDILHKDSHENLLKLPIDRNSRARNRARAGAKIGFSNTLNP